MPDKISTAKLPSTAPTSFGREKELAALDAAWNGPHPVPPPTIGGGPRERARSTSSRLVAWGGVGKSALVNQWLAQMARQNYCGAERVYRLVVL